MGILPLLLLGVLLSAGDPCTCGGCLVPHVQVVGSCAGCRKAIPSASDKLCGACADSRKACRHCSKELGTRHLFIGTATLAEKQPRADLESVVCTPESGLPQGIYRNRAVPRDFVFGARALFVTSRGAQGDHHLESFVPMASKEKDLEVTGESDKPVHWRIGLVEGPESAPKDGKYRLTLPSVSAIRIEVVSGGKVLSRHVFEAWGWRPD